MTGLDAGLDVAGRWRDSTPDESCLFAGIGALSTWAVMRMTDSCEFQFYARCAHFGLTVRNRGEMFRDEGMETIFERCVFMGPLGMNA